jgi:hypothetical protein
MKLIERNNNNGQTRTIAILERLDSPGNVNLIIDDVYSRGLGIKHFVVDAKGNEQEVEMLTDCPAEKPYVAIGRIER